jgi:hypothetical protein
MINKSIEELREELSTTFSEFTKTDEYKEQLDYLKAENSGIREYLLHLSMYYNFREEYLEKLEPDLRMQFIDVHQHNDEQKEEVKSYEVKAIGAFTPEEHLEKYGELKEAKYQNVPEDEKPFEIIGVSED